MATITRYVDPNAAAGGDGTTNGLSGSTCAYASMAIWEAAQQQDLTDGGGDIAECICDSNGGAADTTNVIIDGWTTGADSYIWIHTPTSSRHDGKWNTSKYRLTVTSSNCITSYESFIRIDGIQMHVTSSANHRAFSMPTFDDGGVHYYSNLIIRATLSGTSVGTGFSATTQSTGTRTRHIWNCVVYDWVNGTNACAGLSVSNGNGYTNYLYNNTLHNCYTGIVGNSNTHTRNNLIRSCNTATSGLTAGNQNYNATDNASLGYTAQANDRTSQTFTFVDEANDDFHLASSDSGAKDFGVSDPGSGLFSDDIDGQTRSGSWDIGADEYVAGGVIEGQASLTQDAHTVSATGEMPLSGGASLSQGNASLSAIGDVAITGAAALVQGGNSISATGTIPITGTAAIVQDAQSISSAGTMLIAGVAALQQDSNSLNAAGTVSITGEASMTQTSHTLSATGTVGIVGTVLRSRMLMGIGR